MDKFEGKFLEGLDVSLAMNHDFILVLTHIANLQSRSKNFLTEFLPL